MLGVHVSKTSILKSLKPRDTILDAIQEDCKHLDINAVQIFTHGPRNTHRNKIDTKAIVEFCKENEVFLSIHSSYILGNVLWKITSESMQNDAEASKKYMDHFLDQIKISKELNNVPIVIHLPRLPIDNVINTIKILAGTIIKNKSLILFEHIPCTDSKAEYASPERLNELVKRLGLVLPKQHWGLCLDTAHIWSCGIDLRTYKAQEHWFSELNKDTKEMIKLIHLNGSVSKTFYTNKDVHYLALSEIDDLYHFTPTTDINKLGVVSICKFAKSHKIPIICEIHIDRESSDDEIISSLKLLKSLLA